MGDWTRASIGDFFDLHPGYAFKSADFVDAGVPVIKIKNIKAGEFSEHEFSYVSPLFLNSRANKLTKPDDLLISMSGNRHDGSPETWVGKVALFRKHGAFFINQRVGALRPKPGAKIDIRFASFLLSSLPYQELFISIATSSGGQANLSPQQILTAPLPYPNLATQVAIGELLGALDDKIDLIRRMNETLEGMARAIFRDWFVDFGPTRAKAERRLPYLAEELWRMFPDRLDDEGKPIGWPIRRWKELASLEYGKRLEGYKTNGGLIPVYGTNGPIGWYDTALCLEPGVIIGRKGAYRGVHFSDGPFYVIDTAFFMKFKKASSSRWAYYTVAGYDIDSMDSGSAIPSTSRDDFGSILVIEPPYSVQSKFDQLLVPLWAKEQANISENETLVQFRDFLLPKLMSGEIRVKEAEKIMAEVA